MKKVLALLLLLLLAPAGSGLEPLDFADEELRLRYQRLAAELRCPKCSNQSLRDSDAPVAANLRQALHRLLHEGRSDEEILAFMSERYGDFIRYRPRFFAAAPLWLAPLLLGVAGLLLMLRYYRRRRQGALAGAVPFGGEQAAVAGEGTLASTSGKQPAGTPSPQLLFSALLLAAVLGSLALYEGLGARQDWQLAGQLEGQPDWEALMPLLETRYRSDPENPQYMALLARGHMEMGQFQAAMEVYKSLAVLMPEDKVLQRMAALAKVLAETSAAKQQPENKPAAP